MRERHPPRGVEPLRRRAQAEETILQQVIEAHVGRDAERAREVVQEPDVLLGAVLAHRCPPPFGASAGASGSASTSRARRSSTDWARSMCGSAGASFNLLLFARARASAAASVTIEHGARSFNP
jgi:hypothetical protein